MKLAYLEPKLKTTPYILVLCIIALFIWFIIQYNYVIKNWDNVKCEKGRFFIAPLFGKNSQTTFEECIAQEQSSSIQSTLEPIYSKIQNIDDKLNSFNNYKTIFYILLGVFGSSDNKLIYHI